MHTNTMQANIIQANAVKANINTMRYTKRIQLMYNFTKIRYIKKRALEGH